MYKDYLFTEGFDGSDEDATAILKNRINRRIEEDGGDSKDYKYSPIGDIDGVIGLKADLKDD